MEVYTSISFTTQSVPQAAAFTNAFLDELADNVDSEISDILNQLNNFRHQGGCFQLEEIMLKMTGTYEEEFRKIFLNTAQAVPDVPFEAKVITSGDEHAENLFEYAGGYFKRRYWYMIDWPVQDYCPECGIEFPESISLADWIDAGRKDVCPQCGHLLFEPDWYTLKEEKIPIQPKVDNEKESADTLFNLLWALQKTKRNKSLLNRSKICGCGKCLEIFSPSEIRWWQSDDTARCPHCGSDSILGDASGFHVTEEFLGQMCRYLKEKWSDELEI